MESELNINDILGQTEQQSKEEYNNFRVAKIREKLYYPVLRGGVSPEHLRNVADGVKKEGLHGMLVLPSYVSAVSSILAESECSLAVAVGYPFGEGDVDTIIHAVKTLSKKPVDEIVVVLSVSDLKFLKAKSSEKVLKLLSSVSKKKNVGVMFDASRFITEDLEKVIKIISSYSLTNIYITTGFYGESFSFDNLNTIKASLKKPAKLVSGAQDLSCELAVALMKETDYVFTSKAIDIITQLKQSM